MQKSSITRMQSSFRDPSGFLFIQGGVLYRQVNEAGREAYRQFIDSGLYTHLTGKGWLVEHKEVDAPVADADNSWRILRPERIDFISWPYEWSFGQLKDAALTTLDIQLAAIEHGMILKDASAYNIQFHRGRPVLIDTLSFERYEEGRVWAGYRQFCQHFLAPLVLMARVDIRLSRLLSDFIDGIPLGLASTLLGRSTWLRPGLLMHLHLHARAQQSFADAAASPGSKARGPRRLSRNGLIGIVSGLRRLVGKLEWEPAGTEWASYYNATNYSDDAFVAKRSHIADFLDRIDPAGVWDLGANTGLFSRIAAEHGIPTVACDIDPAAVEINYRQMREQGEKYILPLVMDLTNPSAAIGWASRERESLADRGPVDCAMALALIHHLAISNNVPLAHIAGYFATLCRHLIIEFVPKADSQVQRLLRSREDIFPHYDREHFEVEFARHFTIQRAEPIPGSERILYLMARNDSSQARVDSSAGSH